MPSQAETPQKPPRRSRRPPRKSTGPIPSQVSSSQDGELSPQTEPDRQINQPTRILRRGDPDTTLDIGPVSDLSTSAPRTPPRPKSMYDGSPNQQQPHHDEFTPEITPKMTKRFTTQGRKQSGPVSPMPALNDTPASAPRRGSATPNRANETPVKAYAGPTFHASPAASSLPMPKFFSKSVPNVDKTKSLKSMMDQDPPDSSSGSEESPSLENIKPLSKPKMGEESPLDIFFRADRQAKDRTGSAPDVRSGMRSQATPFESPFNPQNTPRHHSRQSSAGVMFTLEMDGTSPERSSRATSLENPTTISNQDSPLKAEPSVMSQDDREEQRRAQTIALKKLLYSPRPQISHDGSAGQRPPSSKLRKQISMPTSPENTTTPELPATPTPSRTQNTSKPPVNGHKSTQNGRPFTFDPSSPPAKPIQGKSTAFMHDAMSTRTIENDLRRILKLDVLGDGVAGH